LADTPESSTFGGKPLTQPMLLAVLDYWKKKRVGKWLPSRADIDPVELRKLLPYIYLIDVLPAASPDEKMRFRMRLVGTNVRDFAGQDFTNRIIDESIYGPYTQDAIDRLISIVNVRKPHHLHGVAIYQGQRSWQRFEALQLPMSNDGKKVDMIMGANISVSLSSLEQSEFSTAHLDKFESNFLDE